MKERTTQNVKRSQQVDERQKEWKQKNAINVQEKKNPTKQTNLNEGIKGEHTK